MTMAAITDESSLQTAIEVTREEYEAVNCSRVGSFRRIKNLIPNRRSPLLSTSTSTPLASRDTLRKSITQLSTVDGEEQREAPEKIADSRSISNSSVMSVAGNSSVMSAAGNSSVSNFTIGSHDTVKHSNMINKPQKHKKKSAAPPPPMTKKKSWGLKRFIINSGNNKQTTANSDGAEITSNRTRSSPETRSVASSTSDAGRAFLDAAIRGRMDGIDVLSCGPARLSIQEGRNSNNLNKFVENLNPEWTPTVMVMDMISVSGGRDPREIILEGFMPGGEDRWRVRVEPGSGNTAIPVPELSPSDGSDGSKPGYGCATETAAISNLVKSMWGSDNGPTPTHSADFTEDMSIQTTDEILQLASACNVPIDVDEETFIIETATHLRAVHDIASDPLSKGDFDRALVVFETILKGLQIRHEKEPHFLIGSTLHNIGIIKMWQGKFEESLARLHEAVAVRMASLPPKHADVTVSLVHEAFALLALNRLNDATVCLETALRLSPENSTVRAKVLNNLGVIQFQNQDFLLSLKTFASALEIQRKWLESKVRRESIIFDATTTLNNMGKLYLEKKDFQTAFVVYEEALLLQRTTFRKAHPIVLTTTGNFAYAKLKHGDYKKAIQVYRSLWKEQESLYNADTKQYSEAMGILGFAYYEEGKEFDEALKYLKLSLKWQETHLDSLNPALRATKDTIRKIGASKLKAGGSLWV